MPYMEYTSPGAAFSNTLEDAMMRQQALKHQALIDSLSQQREARLDAAGREALDERKMELELQMKKENRAEVTTRLKDIDLRRGEVIPSDLIDQAREAGVPVPTLPPPAPVSAPGPLAPPAPAGIAAPNAPPAPQGPGMPAAPLPLRFGGTPTQNRQADFLKTLKPGSAEERAYSAEAAGFKTPPSEFKDPTTIPDKPVFRISSDKGTLEKVGSLPPGGIIEPEPQPKTPKDTSFAEAAKADREAKTLQSTREKAYAELNKRATPIEGQTTAVNDLGIMINAMTPEADTLIAPLILKATVSGMGSGFRMTRAEIENVIGGRSKWESMKATLLKWNTDPTKALSITPEQRTQMRSLVKSIRDKARKLSTEVDETRDAIDEATSENEVNRLRTKLAKDMHKMDMPDEPPDGSGGSGGSAATTLPPGVTVKKRVP